MQLSAVESGRLTRSGLRQRRPTQDNALCLRPLKLNEYYFVRTEENIELCTRKSRLSWNLSGIGKNNFREKYINQKHILSLVLLIDKEINIK